MLADRVATVLEGQQGIRPGMQVIVSLEQNFDLLGEGLLKEVQSEVVSSVALGGCIASHKQLNE